MALFPIDIFIAYLAAVLVVVVAPGPDNILAISRGLSQGPVAAALSSVGAGLGIMVHTVAATLGLALVLQTSPLAFLAVKLVGAAYLLWLGYKALRSRNLISFEPVARQPLRRVFWVGLLSNVLNPKPGLFVLAFLPQFVDPAQPQAQQYAALGALFVAIDSCVMVLYALAGRQAVRHDGGRDRLGDVVGAGVWLDVLDHEARQGLPVWKIIGQPV